MGERAAEQAVIDFLCAPARALAVVGGGSRTPQRLASARPWSADADSVEFLKERAVLGQRLYAVGFSADHVRHGPTHMTMLVRAERVRGSWTARSMSGVSGPAELPPTEPRVKLGGSWGHFGFCGGGPLFPAGADVARVRVRFANGVELDDDTEAGWVLFYTDMPVERPDATVELLDRRNEIVSRFEWPWARDLPDALRQRIPKR
jgi:hypothetical protein